MLFAIFLKSLNVSLHQLNSKNNDQFCYLREYFSIATVSCRLLQQMARMDMF